MFFLPLSLTEPWGHSDGTHSLLGCRSGWITLKWTAWLMEVQQTLYWVPFNFYCFNYFLLLHREKCTNKSTIGSWYRFSGTVSAGIWCSPILSITWVMSRIKWVCLSDSYLVSVHAVRCDWSWDLTGYGGCYQLFTPLYMRACRAEHKDRSCKQINQSFKSNPQHFDTTQANTEAFLNINGVEM